MAGDVTNGGAVKAWRDKWTLSQGAAATVLDVTRQTVARWEGDPDSPIPAAAAERLAKFDGERAAGDELPLDLAPQVKPRRPKGARMAAPAPKAKAPQLPRGLHVGKDGLIYGRFEEPCDRLKTFMRRKGGGMVITRIEVFESASGHGGDSRIVWGLLAGEPKSAEAPILAGKHYRPARVEHGTNGHANPKGGAGKPKKAA